MMNSTNNRVMFYVILALTGFMLAACGGPMVKNTVSATDPAYQAIIPEEPYRIHAGDSLDVKFYYNPELNETVTVRPDRKISLQLVHDVMAAGLTPEELSQILADKYRGEVKKPVITVIVRTFNGYKVYVDGEVTRPGMQAMVEEMTLLQSVSGAGGFKPTARLNEILVLRRDKDNKPGVMTVDLNTVMDGTDLSHDITLRANDIVFVPRSAIANVNQWMDQYIRKNIPIPIGVGYGLNP